MFLRAHVAPVTAEKLENLLRVFGDTTRGFVGVYQTVQKPQHGLHSRLCPYAWSSGSNMAAVWLQRFPLWCGCEGIVCEEKLLQQATGMHHWLKGSSTPFSQTKYMGLPSVVLHYTQTFTSHRSNLLPGKIWKDFLNTWQAFMWVDGNFASWACSNIGRQYSRSCPCSRARLAVNSWLCICWTNT